MTGELAQIIALASYGNAFLTTGEWSRDFYTSHSTFQFCRKVDFIELKKSFFSSKRIVKSMVANNYFLSALQVLYCAAAGSSVFGGMGSWNDLRFYSEEDQKQYDSLSARLYDDINQAIIAPVNSY